MAPITLLPPGAFNPPLQNSQFTLDSSGVAGFFGGDEAVSAMATVHVYGGRKWLGWYNSPGSYEIAKRYGQLANSRFWDGLFPGINVDPAQLFELDGYKGPKFQAARSGTIIPQTGHLGYLISRASEDAQSVVVAGRETTRSGVTILDLHYSPPPAMHPKLLHTYSGLIASFPIVVSTGTAVACALVGDWWCFCCIVLGIVASGLSCFVIGSGRLQFRHPEPAQGAPRGDGMLILDQDVVLLRGEEGAVNSITRGRFALHFSSEPEYRNIGFCSMLLTIQFLAQLLLIPQGSLFGQLMFLASLGTSWMYNTYLSSLDKEKVQTEILMGVLDRPVMRKFSLGTRTSMAVFTVLVLKPRDPKKLLEELLPNDTEVWQRWRESVTRKLLDGERFCFKKEDWDAADFNENDKEMLRILYVDAQAANDGYEAHVMSRPPSTMKGLE